MTRTSRPLTSVLALLCASVALAACGSSSSKKESTATPAPASTKAPSASGGGTTLKLSAKEGGTKAFSFDKTALTAKAGTVSIVLDSPSGDKAPHAIAFEGNGIDKDGNTVQPGGTSKVSATLKPGTYTFYCPVDGHRQLGMEGTLTVQ